MDKNSFNNQLRFVSESISLYWRIYGGWRTLISSPYLIISFIFTVSCYPLWTCKTEWYNLSISTLPNLLGFTLGGYAILLAFGNDKFLKNLSARDIDDTGPSPFMNVNGAFVHFIMVQVCSLLVAILSFSWKITNGFMSFLGVSLFFYSLFTGIAAALAVLRLGKWYDIFLNKEYWKEEKKKELESKVNADCSR